MINFSFKRLTFSYRKILFLLLFVILFFPSGVFASSKTRTDEIRAEFVQMLDREPAQEESAHWKSNFRNKSFLRSELNASSERGEVIKKLYQQALKRNPRDDELKTLKQFVAPISAIKNQIYQSPERTAALRDLYRGLLRRDPSSSELEFYSVTRSPFDKIIKVLNNSEERKKQIFSLYQELFEKDPTEEEFNSFLESQMYLGAIYRSLEKSGKIKVYSLIEYTFENRFYLSYPKDWERKIISPKEAVAFINPVADYDSDHNSLNAFITVGITPQKVITPEYSQKALNDLKESGVSNIYPVSSENTIHEGAAARDAQYTFQYQSKEYIRYRVVRIETALDIYTISFFGYEEKYLEYKNLFDTIVKSWRIL